MAAKWDQKRQLKSLRLKCGVGVVFFAVAIWNYQAVALSARLDPDWMLVFFCLVWVACIAGFAFTYNRLQHYERPTHLLLNEQGIQYDAEAAPIPWKHVSKVTIPIVDGVPQLFIAVHNPHHYLGMVKRQEKKRMKARQEKTGAIFAIDLSSYPYDAQTIMSLCQSYLANH